MAKETKKYNPEKDLKGSGHFITIKNLKHSPSLSRETEAHTASVYVDKVLVGYSRNSGRGGCTDVDPTGNVATLQFKKGKAMLQALRSLTDYEEADCEKYLGMEFPFCDGVGSVVDDLVSAHIEIKEMQRLCKNRLVCHVDGRTYEEGTFTTFKIPHGQSWMSVKLHLESKGRKFTKVLNEELEMRKHNPPKFEIPAREWKAIQAAVKNL